MPDTSKDRGLVGQSVKEEWLGDVKRAQHAQDMKGMPPMPKGMKMPPYEPPWTSVGQAPSEQQVEREADGGSA